MTRDQALDESLPWLQMLAAAASRRDAREALMMLDTSASAQAAGISEKGHRAYQTNRKALIKELRR